MDKPNDDFVQYQPAPVDDPHLEKAPPTPQQPLKPIDASEFEAIPDEKKGGIMGGVHANLMVHPPLEKAMHECRLLGYAKAREEGVPENEVVVILAHDAPYEVFFKDHAKLDEAERERMIAALSPEDTTAYEILVETEKAETKPADIVAARTARIAFEVAWATARWRWKRFAHLFEGAPWTTFFAYRNEISEDPTVMTLAADPITLDPGHPWTGFWNTMLQLVPAGDGVRNLIIAGNQASVQIGVFKLEEAPKPEFQSAEAYAASLR